MPSEKPKSVRRKNLTPAEKTEFLDMLNRNCPAADISKKFNMKLGNVYKITYRLRQVSPRKESYHYTPSFVQRMNTLLEEDPTRTSAQIATLLGYSGFAVNAAMKKEGWVQGWVRTLPNEGAEKADPHKRKRRSSRPRLSPYEKAEILDMIRKKCPTSDIMKRFYLPRHTVLRMACQAKLTYLRYSSPIAKANYSKEIAFFLKKDPKLNQAQIAALLGCSASTVRRVMIEDRWVKDVKYGYIFTENWIEPNAK